MTRYLFVTWLFGAAVGARVALLTTGRDFGWFDLVVLAVLVFGSVLVIVIPAVSITARRGGLTPPDDGRPPS